MKSGETPSQRTTDDQLRTTFVRRLERLLRMRRDYRDDLNPLGFRLLDRAIQATYQDCLDHGASGEAKAIMNSYSTHEAR
jgi:hypothetical protein